MWDLPGPRMELMSLASQGRFFTIEPPAKPRLLISEKNISRGLVLCGINFEDTQMYQSVTKYEVKIAQLCLTLCNPVDYAVHGILQARILEWVAYPFSSGSSQPRNQTRVSWTAGRFFTSWATMEARIKPVNPKGKQPWIFIGRTDAEAPILWPPDVKSWLSRKDPDSGKDWRQEEKGAMEHEMVGWHQWPDGHEVEQTLGDSEGQESLVCCCPWGHKELDTTEWLNNNKCIRQMGIQKPWQTGTVWDYSLTTVLTLTDVWSSVAMETGKKVANSPESVGCTEGVLSEPSLKRMRDSWPSGVDC